MTDFTKRLADYEAKSTHMDADSVLQTYDHLYAEDVIAIAHLAWNVYARQNPNIYCMKGARERAFKQMQQVIVDALETRSVDTLGTMEGCNDFPKKSGGMKTRGGK